MSSFLFINQYAWPDEAATAQLLMDLAEDLVLEGHQVTLLCGRSRYACREELIPGRSERRGVRIERVGGTDRGRRTIKDRLGDMASFFFMALRRLDRLARHDVVIAMSSPPLVGKLGVKFHRKNRVPLVLWSQDLYPEVAERLGSLRNPIVCKWLRGQVRQIYRVSSKIIVPGEKMQQELSVYRETDGKIAVIQNWADMDQIQSLPVLENSFRKQRGWGDDPVLMYSGNLGPAHELDTMLELVKFLQARRNSIRIILVGDSGGHHEFMRRVREMKLNRVEHLPSQPRAQLSDLLGAADAHLVSQKPEAQSLVVPSKFYGIVAAGRPVIFIGSRASDLGRSIREGHLGVVVEPGQAHAGIEEVCGLLASSRDESLRLREGIRSWAEENASRRMRTRQFRVLLEGLVAC